MENIEDLLEEFNYKLDLRILANPRFEEELIRALGMFKANNLTPEIEVIDSRFLRLKGVGKATNIKPVAADTLKQLTIEFKLGNIGLKDPLIINVEEITVVDAETLSEKANKKPGTIIHTFYSQRIMDLYGIEMSYSNYFDADRIDFKNYHQVLADKQLLDYQYLPQFRYMLGPTFSRRRVNGFYTNMSREYDNLGLIHLTNISGITQKNSGLKDEKVYSIDMSHPEALTISGPPLDVKTTVGWVPNIANPLVEGMSIDDIYDMLRTNFLRSVKTHIESDPEYPYEQAFLRIFESHKYPKVEARR